MPAQDRGPLWNLDSNPEHSSGKARWSDNDLEIDPETPVFGDFCDRKSFVLGPEFSKTGLSGSISSAHDLCVLRHRSAMQKRGNDSIVAGMIAFCLLTASVSFRTSDLG